MYDTKKVILLVTSPNNGIFTMSVIERDTISTEGLCVYKIVLLIIVVSNSVKLHALFNLIYQKIGYSNDML